MLLNSTNPIYHRGNQDVNSLGYFIYKTPMLKLYAFPRDAYTLLILEQKDFQSSDLLSLEQQYRSLSINLTKGTVIACAPETNLIAIADLFSFFRDRTPWQGAYMPGNGILIGNVRACIPAPKLLNGSEAVRGHIFKAQIPCLECFRESGQEVLLKSSAMRPYCEGHYARSPHRSGSRRKKRT